MVSKEKEKLNCPKCKSGHIVHHGSNVTVKKGTRQRLKCQKCGSTFYENKERDG